MARRRKSPLSKLLGNTVGTNRGTPPAAQFGFGKKPRRGNVPFIDKPWR